MAKSASGRWIRVPKRARSPLAAAVLTLLASTLAPLASAAPTAGTPVIPAPGVPGHGRAWELVTPPDFNQAFTTAVSAVSAHGDRVVFRTLGPLSGAELPALLAVNLAVRGRDGWTSNTLSPPAPAQSLEAATGEGDPLAFDPELRSGVWGGIPAAGVDGLFKGPPAGPFSRLFAAPGTYGGASADLGHVLYLSAEHLLPADAGRVEGSSIYDSTPAGLRLVDVDNGGALLSDCGSRAPAISADGNRVFFVVQPCGGAPSRVYLREGGVTKEASASQCGLADCGPPAPADLVATTPSGSSAFILSAEKLTDADADEAPDLYRYDSADGSLTLVSTVAPGLDVDGGDVSPSPDGSRVFFCAHDAAEELVFLADEHGLRTVPLSCGPIQWSADSRYATFLTKAPVLPADSDGLADLYRYDAASGSFGELSVGAGTGNGPFAVSLAAAFEGVGETAGLPARSVSESGEDAVFSTAERLLPQDRNDSADVYEWASGSLSLVSPGVGDAPVFPLGISGDGREVFLKTSATLLPRDRDGGGDDLYAAVIGGGFPEPVPPAPECGRACDASSGQRIATTTPASARPLRGGIRLAPLDAAARRRAAASGNLLLRAEAPRPGRLNASAEARLGGAARTVASATVRVAQPGPVSLSMRLSAAARKRLAGGHGLRLELVLGLSSIGSRQRLALRLPGSS